MKRIEFNGELVVDTKHAAEMFGCTPKELLASFAENKDVFHEGVHYYVLDEKFAEFDKFKRDHLDAACAADSVVYLWTEEGLYEHAAAMRGIQAWHAYCQLIYFFFEESEEVKQAVEVLQKADDVITKERILYYMAKELFSNETSNQ